MSPIEPSNSYKQKTENKIIETRPKLESKSKLKAENLNQAENQAEITLRPNSLDEYIGQERLKKILMIGISAALKRGDSSSMGHILLYGPPGLGKTTCAFLLSKLIGSQAHVFSAPSLDKPKDIVGVLMSLQKDDILFIDEIHRLNKITEELLYPPMEDYCLDLSSGNGASTRITRLPLPKFILVGATTKLGNISAPLRDRFTHIQKMEFYQEADLITIANRTAKILNFDLSPKASQMIASRSRGTPRITNRLCRLVRDFSAHKNTNLASPEVVEEAFTLFQIDECGLENTDREILKTLIENYNGGPAGLETLSATIGEDARTLEDFYEPFLMQLGFLERTSKGRKATTKAYQYLGYS